MKEQAPGDRDMKRASRTIFPLLICSLILLFLAGDVFPQDEKTYGLAVMRLRATGISETEAETLTETLHSGISRLIVERNARLKEKYTLIERSQMDKILEQFQVQDSGCTDEKCAVEFGKMLAVERIIVGSIGLVGNTYAMTGRLVDVESSKVIRSVSRTYEGKIDNVLFIIPLVGEELLTGIRPPDPPNLAGRVSRPASPSASQPASQPATQPGLSYLSVDGSPASAEVRIDGQSVGSAPIQFYSLAPGKHTVLVTGAGYEDFSREIVIEPEKRQKMSFSLVPLAKLSVKGSPDGATVAIDGKEVGRTPLDAHQLPRGTYELTITRDGYTEHIEKITLSPGDTRAIGYSLAAIVKASISSMPEGAEVYIDGEKAGVTPLRNPQLTEGKHVIAIRRMGYETHRQEIEIAASSPPDLNPVLIPKTKSGVLKRSAFLPGSGQCYAGYGGKGTFIAVLQVVTVAGAIGATLSATQANDDYDGALSTYRGITQTNSQLLSDARAKVDDTYNKASDAATLQMGILAAVAAVYAWNIIDAALTSPKVEVSLPANSLRFEPRFGKDSCGITLSARF